MATILEDGNYSEDGFEDIVDDFEFPEEEDEPFIITNNGTEADEIFDRWVEALEKVALGVEDGLPAVLRDFMRQNCHVFADEAEENSLASMDAFQQYTSQIESYLDQEMKKEVPDFSMDCFLEQLDGREDDISPDALELLTSLADFDTFKELMICEKNAMESPLSRGAMADLCVFGRETHIFSEEQEDGELRPDLNLQIRCHNSPERSRKRICGSGFNR